MHTSPVLESLKRIQRGILGAQNFNTRTQGGTQKQIRLSPSGLYLRVQSSKSRIRLGTDVYRLSVERQR